MLSLITPVFSIAQLSDHTRLVDRNIAVYSGDSMPFSFSSQLSTIVGFAEKLHPRSVLDVGTGMGQYGFLLRNNLESVNLFEIQGDQGRQRDRSQWQIRIDGIEGFREYLTPVHHYAYTNLLIGNALDLLPNIPTASYELVLAIDILEHFTIEDAASFINECKRVCSGAFLISTPKEFIEQDIPANPLENHRSFWSEDDLKRYGFTQFLPDPMSWIGVYRGSPLP